LQRAHLEQVGEEAESLAHHADAPVEFGDLGQQLLVAGLEFLLLAVEIDVPPADGLFGLGRGPALLLGFLLQLVPLLLQVFELAVELALLLFKVLVQGLVEIIGELAAIGQDDFA
jgi:hypothetical protein